MAHHSPTDGEKWDPNTAMFGTIEHDRNLYPTEPAAEPHQGQLRGTTAGVRGNSHAARRRNANGGRGYTILPNDVMNRAALESEDQQPSSARRGPKRGRGYWAGPGRSRGGRRGGRGGRGRAGASRAEVRGAAEYMTAAEEALWVEREIEAGGALRYWYGDGTVERLNAPRQPEPKPAEYGYIVVGRTDDGRLADFDAAGAAGVGGVGAAGADGNDEWGAAARLMEMQWLSGNGSVFDDDANAAKYGEAEWGTTSVVLEKPVLLRFRPDHAAIAQPTTIVDNGHNDNEDDPEDNSNGDKTGDSCTSHGPLPRLADAASATAVPSLPSSARAPENFPPSTPLNKAHISPHHFSAPSAPLPSTPASIDSADHVREKNQDHHEAGAMSAPNPAERSLSWRRSGATGQQRPARSPQTPNQQPPQQPQQPQPPQQQSAANPARDRPYNPASSANNTRSGGGDKKKDGLAAGSGAQARSSQQQPQQTNSDVNSPAKSFNAVEAKEMMKSDSEKTIAEAGGLDAITLKVSPEPQQVKAGPPGSAIMANGKNFWTEMANQVRALEEQGRKAKGAGGRKNMG